MKRFLIFLTVLAPVFAALVACEKSKPEQTFEITVSLMNDGASYAEEGLAVALRSVNGSASYEAVTDAAGTVSFIVPTGTYEASASFRTIENGTILVYNGVNSSIVVGAGSTSYAFELALTASETNQVVIKELYVGGCPKDDGSGYYQYDKYVILYNNSSEPATLSNLALGTLNPFNSNATNKYYDGTSLIYTDWIPASYAVWWFQGDVTIEPYSDLVVALNGALNHTETYSQSVDLSNGDYYVTYDPESGYTNVNYYPAPSESIPESHYLQTYVFGLGNGWILSNNSPAFFIFSSEGTTPEAFSQDPSNVTSVSEYDKMLPVSWVIDGIEVFRAGYDNNLKRFVPSIDAGSVTLTAQLGYTLYRNVDKEATEALPENEGLLVYNYAGGTEAEENGSTDPSGIDAEASIAAGAHIIYLDTNNSSNDFHQRSKASLRK